MNGELKVSKIQQVHLNNCKQTLFSLYQYDQVLHAWVFIEERSIEGWYKKPSTILRKISDIGGSEVMTDTQTLLYCRSVLRQLGLVVIQDRKRLSVKCFRKVGVLYYTYDIGILLENVESGYFDKFTV
jgi:hypothetical protein